MKKTNRFFVFVLFLLVTQINSASMAIAGEFFKGKVTGENNRPLPNIKITVNGFERATTDQSGDFSFPVESLVWGMPEYNRPIYSVEINKQDSQDTNALYLSHYLEFRLLWGDSDKLTPRYKIKIIEAKGTAKFEDDADGITKIVNVGRGEMMLKDRLTIRLGERADVKELQKFYKNKNRKEFIERGSAFLEANKSKKGISELQQLISEAQIKLAEEELLQKKLLEEFQKKLNKELPPIIVELKRSKETNDLTTVVSKGNSYLSKYPNTKNSYLSEIETLVKDAENKIELKNKEIEAIKEQQRKKEEQLKSAKEAQEREKEAKKEQAHRKELLSKCNGVIMTLIEFYSNNNPYADKGRCTKIEAVAFQMTSSTSGLFQISDDGDLVYIEFKKPFRGRFVEGVAKIKGVYTYKTNSRHSNTVPLLQMIEKSQ